MTALYDKITDRNLLIRRINIAACKVITEDAADCEEQYEQLDLFTDFDELEKTKKAEDAALLREKKMQKAMICIKKKYGKNAVLKGMNFEEGATAKDRNSQIGGHRK